MFFQYADHYYYQNPNADFHKLNDNQLFGDFEKYLDTNNYRFHSLAEDQVNQLLAEIKDKKADKDLNEGLKRIKNEFEKLGNSELKIYRDEIIHEIKIELASRYLGNDGMIRDILANDNQFQTALRILSDTTVYDKLLNIN